LGAQPAGGDLPGCRLVVTSEHIAPGIVCQIHTRICRNADLFADLNPDQPYHFLAE
jgi:hypothetical protein